MKSILTAILASFFALLPGSGALAEHGLGLEIETTGSHHYGTLDKGKDKFQTNEFRLGAHKQLGEMPLSLGLSAGKTNIVAISDHVGRNEGYDLSVEAKAWLPEKVTGSKNFKPFVRLAHTGYSYHEFKVAGQKYKGTNDGLTAGVGASYNLTDSASASLEYQYKQKAVKLKDLDKQSYKSHGVSVGLAYAL